MQTSRKEIVLKLTVYQETWPIAGTFRIARDSVSAINIVCIELGESGFVGRGECRPYARYGESCESVFEQLYRIRPVIGKLHIDADIQHLLPPGAARNALDCALWDLRAKTRTTPIWKIMGLPKPKPRKTAYTLSVDTPVKMTGEALKARQYPVLKLKIAGAGGLESCLTVMEARPDAQLIIDANESLTPDTFQDVREILAPYPVLMIEQPLSADQDDQFESEPDALPVICADESLHTRDDLRRLWDSGYRAVNVKLDKCGGLTETLALVEVAKSMGFLIMIGCLVGTSLAMAPMMMLESYADFIDLDGPLLLAKDRKNGMCYDGEYIHPPEQKFWG